MSHLSQQLEHEPRVILAGRGTNDRMGSWIADRLHDERGKISGSVLVLGLTFKENVPDLRNSRVIDVIKRLIALGHQVAVTDPVADPEETRRQFGLTMATPEGRRYDMIVGTVTHAQYRAMDAAALTGLVAEDGTIADIKGMWRELDFGPIRRWTL